MSLPKLLLLFCFIICSHYASAQQTNWEAIESSIIKKENLAELTRQLEQIKKDALLHEQYAVYARSWYHQMQIADLKSEDTAYFTNGFFIDSILQEEKAPLLLKSIMLLLKAKRIAGFRHRFFYRLNKNLFQIYEGRTDYTKMNLAELDGLRLEKEG